MGVSSDLDSVWADDSGLSESLRGMGGGSGSTHESDSGGADNEGGGDMGKDARDALHTRRVLTRTDATHNDCPHCDDWDVRLTNENTLDGKHQMQCHRCGMRSPIRSNHIEAVKAWNDMRWAKKKTVEVEIEEDDD